MYVTASVQEQENNLSTIKSNRTMSNEIFVAFATQKGGIGKSTVTALAASYLHNVQGHNVAVIDCDAPQHSIHGLRERETKLIDESLYFKALACDHFRKIKKNAYPVIASDALNALDDAERMLAEEDAKPNIVFFDMPGTLKSNGVVKTLSQMDYIFAPMSADRFVVESTLQFAVMFRDNLMTTGQAKTKGLYLFWTMVDGREKNGLYDLYEDVIAEMGLSVLSTRLPDSKKFRRDLSEERKSVFRSTIFPMDVSLLKGSGIPSRPRLSQQKGRCWQRILQRKAKPVPRPDMSIRHSQPTSSKRPELLHWQEPSRETRPSTVVRTYLSKHR